MKILLFFIQDGDIYTDRLFEKELKEYFKEKNVNVDHIGYSEYGMQGNNFVSIDVDSNFIEDFCKKIKEKINS